MALARILLKTIALALYFLVGNFIYLNLTSLVFCGSPYYIVKAIEPKKQEPTRANFYPSRPWYKGLDSKSVPEGSCVETTASCNGNLIPTDPFAMKLLLYKKNKFCSREDYYEMRNVFIVYYTVLAFYFGATIFILNKVYTYAKKR